MTEKDFWFAKILQILHDPPGKPFSFWPKTGGHKKLAEYILEIIIKKKRINTIADSIATGADRPLLTLPSDKSDRLGIQHFYTDLLVTHPLGKHSLSLNEPFGVEKISSDITDEIIDLQKEVAKEFRIEDIGSIKELHDTFLSLWRRFKEDIIKTSGDISLWEFMPADSRCPDHSIWEHNRVTSALAFVEKELKSINPEDAQYPWLLSFSLRPVQEFLKQARKSQDLWTGSMLIAELSWAAIKVVSEHYGPDCIIYPDLRGNPRADMWLYESFKEAIPEGINNIATRAAIVPHTFVAIVPYGSSNRDNHLIPIKDLATKACNAVQDKWTEFADDVKGWMEGVVRKTSDGFSELWNHARKNCPLEPTWAAIPWHIIEKQNQYYFVGRAIICQKEEEIEKPDPEVYKIIKRREEALGKWIPKDSWTSYEYELSVFARTNEGLLLKSGYVYAPCHHKLKSLHALRRRIIDLPEPTPPDYSYEKCTICHTKGAIGNEKITNDKATGETIRQKVREFWQNKNFDPEEKGNERLCAICSIKRFLVRSESEAFNKLWIGTDKKIEDEKDRDERLRTPFPSTVAIAAQEYIENLINTDDNQVTTLLDDIVRLHKELKIEFSSFPRALPRFVSISEKHEFLKLDYQLSLFPELVSAKMHSETDPQKKKLWKQLFNKVKELREKTKGSPNTHIAVVVMDGDNMGSLLLGDPNKIKTKWEDVIHPEVVKKIREPNGFSNTGWPELLKQRRMSGPSLQAFISRALANFAHNIVPWVVEQEFPGRLIYVGGDDLLALVPAKDALAMAARLNELFSAHWVIDTKPNVRPWSWLEKKHSSKWDPNEAKKRFVIVTEDKISPEVSGRLLPMLGESASLSAGIMYGHFKTRMGLLLENARSMLDTFAKEKAGRNAAGIGHFSRSGVKTRFAAHWNLKDISLPNAIENIIMAYKKGKIPAALPYKLTEYLNYVDPLALDLNEEESLKLMSGLLSKAMDNKEIKKELKDSILHIWTAGNRLMNASKDIAICQQETKENFSPLDGLFLCRYLSGHMEGQ